MIRVGTLLYGFCGGYFGDTYEAKRVEAMGVDWLVAREVDSGKVCFCDVPPETLESYSTPEESDE